MPLTRTAIEVLDLLRTKKISALEVCEAYLSQMENIRGLNAFVTETPEIARKNAEDSHERYQKGTPLPLDGLPFAHKDLFLTEGVLTTASSRILSNFIPPYESTVSQKLKDAGRILDIPLIDHIIIGVGIRNNSYYSFADEGLINNPDILPKHLAKKHLKKIKQKTANLDKPQKTIIERCDAIRRRIESVHGILDKRENVNKGVK